MSDECRCNGFGYSRDGCGDRVYCSTHLTDEEKKQAKRLDRLKRVYDECVKDTPTYIYNRNRNLGNE